MTPTDGGAGRVAIEPLAPEASTDAALVERLTNLVNQVYAVAEEGLWVDGTTRTTGPEMRRLIGQGEIAVATIGQDLVGCVRIQQLDGDRGELGMLAVAPDRRGFGVGSALVRFAEQRSHQRGSRTMELELLVPRGWVHPSKRVLDEWYRRLGYRVARTGTIDHAYPRLAPLLATPCELVTYRKPLIAETTTRTGPFWDGLEGRAPIPPAAATLGLQPIAVDEQAGTIELAFQATEAFTNPTGNVLGAFLAAMLYDTVGPALLATVRPHQFQSTLEIKVNFLRPTRPGRLVGRGRVLHRVGDLAYLEASLHAADDSLIATATATARVIDLDQAPGAV